MSRYNERKTTVQGKTYTIWADYILRGMYAENEAGEVQCLRDGGYMRNELSIRKAIAAAYHLDSFRK